MDESRFLVGLDIGDFASSIAYFDARRNQPEIMDISGGYGKPAAPTALCYVPETREWVFGEYAILSDGGVRLTHLASTLAKRERVFVTEKGIESHELMGIYMRELLANLKSLNPKAEIEELSICVPDDFSEDGRDGILKAARFAGADSVALVPARECLIAKASLFGNEFKSGAGYVTFIDYGARAVRASVYRYTASDGGIHLVCLSNEQDDSLAAYAVDAKCRGLFEQRLRRGVNMAANEPLSEQMAGQLAAFSYQHNDLLFQKTDAKNIKLYYNFAYPPFQTIVTADDINGIIAPFEDRFASFIRALAQGCPEAAANPADMTVICAGGGFEMAWARSVVGALFGRSNIIMPKNPKGAFAEGAAARSAQRAGAFRPLAITVLDQTTISADIGVFAGGEGRGVFVPLAYKNAPWRRRAQGVPFYIKDRRSAKIELIRRGEDGFENVAEIVLADFPPAQNVPARILLTAGFETYDTLKIEVMDMGFGDYARGGDYSKTFTFNFTNPNVTNPNVINPNVINPRE